MKEETDSWLIEKLKNNDSSEDNEELRKEVEKLKARVEKLENIIKNLTNAFTKSLNFLKNPETLFLFKHPRAVDSDILNVFMSISFILVFMYPNTLACESPNTNNFLFI